MVTPHRLCCGGRWLWQRPLQGSHPWRSAHAAAAWAVGQRPPGRGAGPAAARQLPRRPRRPAWQPALSLRRRRCRAVRAKPAESGPCLTAWAKSACTEYHTASKKCMQRCLFFKLRLVSRYFATVLWYVNCILYVKLVGWHRPRRAPCTHR